jgi:hypothetical protein
MGSWVRVHGVHEKTLQAVEGQVLDDSKNTIITKEEDGFVNLEGQVRIEQIK